METGKEFTRLLNNLLRENQQYDTELKNFLDYLKQRDLLNKCFDLSLYDIDQFFDSLVGIKMGASDKFVVELHKSPNDFFELDQKGDKVVTDEKFGEIIVLLAEGQLPDDIEQTCTHQLPPYATSNYPTNHGYFP